MSKTGTVIRYDIYKRAYTNRLNPVFIQSIECNEKGCAELFRIATKIFDFDRSEMLIYINKHDLEKPTALSRRGIIVKVFSDCSPKQRIEAEGRRVNGIYGKSLTTEQKQAKEYYQSVLDRLLNLTQSAISQK
jgi:hypothetical protein